MAADQPASEPAGELDRVVATLRELLGRAAARRVALVLDRGAERAPALIECEPGEPVLLTDGEATVALEEPAGTAPLELPPIAPAPEFAVDVDAGEISGPYGGLEALAGSVREAAACFGGRSVLSAEFATAGGAPPLLIAARAGEPLMLAIGEEQFEMPEGWPA